MMDWFVVIILSDHKTKTNSTLTGKIIQLKQLA